MDVEVKCLLLFFPLTGVDILDHENKPFFKNASKLMEVDTEGCGSGNDKSLTWQRALVEFDNQVIKVCGSHSSAGGQ